MRTNMEKAFQITRDYSGDVEKFNEWFADEIEASKASANNFTLITNLLRKIRMTQGLEESLQFVNDIFDSGMSVNFINIGMCKPFSISVPWINRVRFQPFNPAVDKIFDYSLPERHCLLNVTLRGYHPTSNIKWISEQVKEEEKFTKEYGIEEDTFMPEGGYVVRANQACMFDNRFNSDYLFFIQLGFDDNPTYEEVKEKFSKLA